MNSDIISLQEISAANWQAKYRGNYGTYTIKIKLNADKKKSAFSCSCPSDYYPCKHIPIIESAIYSRIQEDKKTPKEKGVTIEEIVKNTSHQELIDFIIGQAKYNPQLTNTILLKFSHNSNLDGENKYRLILRKALKKVQFDYDDLYDYHEDSIEIDVLDEWIEKAKEYLAQKDYKEAIAIAKACIEEYAEWMENTDSDIADYIDPCYQETPFEILSEAASTTDINTNELFQYCKEEMVKPKYNGTGFCDLFNHLLMELAGKEKATEFLNLQDDLLKKITDKSSYEAEKILKRKIEYYNKNNQSDIAQKIVLENIQIESFRKEVVKQKIIEKKYTEAKKLIHDFISDPQNNNVRYNNNWHELVLEIAQKENDIPVIRKIAFAFIENYFQANYYRIYKSTFSSGDWLQEVEKIIEHYSGKGYYSSDSVADVLAEEKDTERLMKYIEKHLSVENLDKYHTHFSPSFPEETLLLFRKAINQYAEKNTGRNHYEHIFNLMKKMNRIKDGKKVVNDMCNQFRVQYKNRKAMMEILNKI
jgi:hypothetical protein